MAFGGVGGVVAGAGSPLANQSQFHGVAGLTLAFANSCLDAPFFGGVLH